MRGGASAETGLFNKVEWGIYQDWHEWLLGAFSNLKLDAIVYLRTTPDTCLKRLQKRARSEEAGVPLEYLKQIHHRHERWLRDRPADFHPAPQAKPHPFSGQSSALYRHHNSEISCWRPGTFIFERGG